MEENPFPNVSKAVSFVISKDQFAFKIATIRDCNYYRSKFYTQTSPFFNKFDPKTWNLVNCTKIDLFDIRVLVPFQGFLPLSLSSIPKRARSFSLSFLSSLSFEEEEEEGGRRIDAKKGRED